MKAVRFHKTGGPEVLTLEEIPTPKPGPGEVLVRIEAAGVNYADTVRRRGDYYPAPTILPHICGGEAVGMIEAVGDGVERAKIGQRVFSSGEGGYAEYQVAPAITTIPFPAGLDPATGIALFVQGLTAALVLREAGHLKPGESVFVPAASGGVGSLALQLAKLWGAGRVIAGASSASKRDLATKLGADAGVDYTRPGWGKELRALTDGRGIDLMLEMTGGSVFDESLDALAPLGRMIVFGNVSNEMQPVPMVRLLANALTISGFYLGPYAARRDLFATTLSELARLTMEGKLKVVVGGTYALSQAAEAHRALEARKSTGKLVILPHKT